MDKWHLSAWCPAPNIWRGRLVQEGEYAAVLDVSHLHDDWTIEDYKARQDAGDAERVWEYPSWEELRAAAVRQWQGIGYLEWGGAELRIYGELAATVAARPPE